jgi:hypothetical protein
VWSFQFDCMHETLCVLRSALWSNRGACNAGQYVRQLEETIDVASVWLRPPCLTTYRRPEPRACDMAPAQKSLSSGEVLFTF